MKIVFYVSLISIVFLSATAFSQTTWYVDGQNPGPGSGTVGDPFSHIQSGIDAAAAGDTVLVMPETYMENLNFYGKAITVISSDGAATTVVDGGQASSVVLFAYQENEDSVLDGFTLTNGSGTYVHSSFLGGGICCYDLSSPTIKNNIITDNGMGNNSGGGGIACAYGCSPTIMENVISHNSADFGGGIYCIEGSSPNVSLNTINDNTAENSYDGLGGGIYCSESYSHEFTDNTVFNNYAKQFGGGIYCEDTIDLEIVDNTITGNRTDNGGGGIYCTGPYSPYISLNDISSNQSKIGGGIYCGPYYKAYITLNTINFNQATYSYLGGAGIFCHELSGPTIKNNTINSNIATNSAGGGVYLSGGSIPFVSENTIELNSSSLGGGVFAGSGARLIDNSICNNSSLSAGGGVYSLGEVLIINNEISLNSSSNKAGGIYIQSGSGANLKGNQICENEAASQGGGIFLENASTVVWENTISKNVANTSGGGIWTEGFSFPEFRRNRISHNKAMYDGGGIVCADGSQARITNNLIFENETDIFGICHGGGIYCFNAKPNILANTIVNNQSASRGGGIYCWDSEGTVINSIIRGNSSAIGEQIYMSSSGTQFWHCNIEDGWPGMGNIDDDPLFVDPGNEDFHLTGLSPCINMGGNGWGPEEDIDVDMRPCMGIVDIGADEYTGVHRLEADKFEVYPFGDTVNMTLDAGVDFNGRKYIILGSLTGTSPGMALPGGYETLPLVWDGLTDFMLMFMNSNMFTDFMGELDGAGQATAQLNFPALPGMLGQEMFFAYTLYQPFDFVSNPIMIEVAF